MIVLALDTTGRAGSLALSRDGQLLEACAGDPARTHGQRLPGDIAALLERHGLRVADVDLFAVAAGPGSFTGLRVGIATIQGLALVNDRSVVPVSALDALAYAARSAAGARPIAAWIDAQRREVFAALYRPATSGDAPVADPSTGLVELARPSVGTPAEILEAWRDVAGGDRAALFTGSGAQAYRDAILQSPVGARAQVLDEAPALAPAIAEIAARRAAAGRAVRPHAIVPVYVRRPDAVIARERRKA